jgi:hypothetical protein
MVMVVLAATATSLGVAVLMKVTTWRPNQSMVTLKITEPVGAEVFGRFVIDGREELRHLTSPNTLSFRVTSLEYELVPIDQSSDGICVVMTDDRGMRWPTYGDGVAGTYQWGLQNGQPTHHGMSESAVDQLRSMIP